MKLQLGMTRTKLSAICGGIVLMPIIILLWIIFSGVVAGERSQEFELKIRSGTSFNQIMRLLVHRNIVESDWKPRFTARLLGWRGKLKAGKYRIRSELSSYGLLKLLVDGRVAVERVTLPEGLQSRELAAILANRIEVDSTRFVAGVQDQDFCKALGIPGSSLEGFLFPDTYDFYWGMNAKQVIRIMVNQFHSQFNDSLRMGAEATGKSIIEILTLASIIEGEAVLDSERALISAVYHNRLRRGMRLQADPTIQFIIPDGPRRLLKKDLEMDSPYNTYRYSGLPPGPINNPGLASIVASMNPARANYLYFVANGDGSHTFSMTLQEHLRAKARFDSYRRSVRHSQKTKGK